MNEVFLWVVVASLSQALWFLPLWALNHKLEQRLNPQWYYRIWIFAFLGLTLAPLIGLVLKQAEPVTLSATPITIAPEIMAASQPADRWQHLGPIWMCGFVLFSMIFVRHMLKARAWARKGEPLPQKHRQRLQHWCQLMGIRRPIEARVIDHPAAPFTLGTLRPHILYRSNGSMWSDRRDFDAATCHELAHIKRLDSLQQTTAWILANLFFFNPLVWVALRKIKEAAEFCCDQQAIQQGIARKAYAQLILRLVTQHRSGAFPMSGHPNLIERRVKNMMLNHKKNRLGISIAIAVAAFGLQGMIWLPNAPELPIQKDEKAELKKELEALRQENEALRAELEAQREAEHAAAWEADMRREVEMLRQAEELNRSQEEQKALRAEQMKMAREQLIALEAERNAALAEAKLQQAEVLKLQQKELQELQTKLRMENEKRLAELQALDALKTHEVELANQRQLLAQRLKELEMAAQKQALTVEQERLSRELKEQLQQLSEEE